LSAPRISARNRPARRCGPPSVWRAAALRAAERLAREDSGAAIRAVGDAFADVDPSEIEAEAVRAVKEARAELAAKRRG